MHTRRKGVWAFPLVRRCTIKRWLSHLYRAALLVFCLPFGQLSGFFFHTWPALGLSPGVQLFPRWIPAQGHRGWPWHYILGGDAHYFLPPRNAFAHVKCLPCPKNGKYTTSWSFTQTVFSPSVFPMTVILKCLQEPKPGCLPHFYCYFFFKVQIGGCKHLTWSPPG